MGKSATAAAPTLVVDTEWLTLHETLDRLKAAGASSSQSTLERLVARKQIETQLARRPGRKPERVYRAADVDKRAEAAKGREARPRALTAPTERSQGQALVLASSMADSSKAMAELLAALPAKIVESTSAIVTAVLAERKKEDPPTTRVRLTEKLWLTWEEAEEYSGIPEPALRRLVSEKRIVGEKFGRGTRIHRASLEAFAG